MAHPTAGDPLGSRLRLHHLAWGVRRHFTAITPGVPHDPRGHLSLPRAARWDELRTGDGDGDVSDGAHHRRNTGHRTASSSGNRGLLMLELRNIRKSYEDQPLLRGISFRIGKNETVCLHWCIGQRQVDHSAADRRLGRAGGRAGSLGRRGFGTDARPQARLWIGVSGLRPLPAPGCASVMLPLVRG